MSHSKSPLPPACALRYAHRKELASGGYGAVHLAVQKDLDRLVVVKLLHTQVLDDAEAVARFQTEARMAAALSSPHVAQLIEAGFDGIPYIVYEYLPGRSVRTLLFDGPLSPALAVRITRHVLAGLSAAHAQGILHRDVKPENVLQAEGELYKVTDFGIAKWTRDGAVKTKTGYVLGTPQYLAPEAILGTALDARADLYSTGVMLHELLSGAAPFTDPNPIMVLEQHLHAPPPPLPDTVLAAEPGLARLLERALAKDPGARYASAELMTEALSQLTCAHSPGALPARQPAPSAWKPGGPATLEVSAEARSGLSGATRAVSRAVSAAGATTSGRFRRRAAFAAMCAALLLGGGLLWATLRPHGPAALTHGTPAERAAQLVERYAAFEKLATPLPEPGSAPRRKRRRREKLELMARRYEGELERHLRDLIAEVDRLSPTLSTHPDLEKVTLPFAFVAQEVAYHAAHLQRLRPDAPVPGAALRSMPAAAWLAAILDAARSTANREGTIRDTAPALREAAPAPTFSRVTDESSILLSERLLDWELSAHGELYVGHLTSATPPDASRRAFDLAIDILAWRADHPPALSTRLPANALAPILRALTTGPWTSKQVLPRRIKAFTALRECLLSRSESAVASQFGLALIGAALLDRESDLPSPIPFPAHPTSTPHDIVTPYLLALRAQRAGHHAAARQYLHQSALALDQKVADRDNRREERSEPRALFQFSRLLLEKLVHSHTLERRARGTPCPAHAACESLIATAARHLLADAPDPTQAAARQKEHRDLTNMLRP